MKKVGSAAPQGFSEGGIVIYKNLKKHCIVVEVGIKNETKSLHKMTDFADIKLKENGTKEVFQPEKSLIQSYGENKVTTLKKDTNLSLIVPFFSRPQDVVVAKDVAKPKDGMYSIYVQQVMLKGDSTLNQGECTEIRTPTLDGLVHGKVRKGNPNAKKPRSSRQDSGRTVPNGSTEGGSKHIQPKPYAFFIITWYIYILHFV